MAAVEEILRQLDAAAASNQLPMLGHPYRYLVTARLHAYSDGERWAMAVEVCGYDHRAANLEDVLHTFGNCLLGESAMGPARKVLRLIDNQPMDDDDETLDPILVEPIIVRGRAIEAQQVGTEDIEDILRRLLPDHRELMLATEEELRALVPADLPEVLRLDEWHHSDVEAGRPGASGKPQVLHLQGKDGTYRTYQETAADVEGRRRIQEMLSRIDRQLKGDPSPPPEHPSRHTEAYRQLALVLATGDPSHYRPTLPPNTHWSNWPESGSL